MAEIALLNPNRYSEVSARRLRPWLERVLPELLRERPLGALNSLGALDALNSLNSLNALSVGVRFAGDRAMRRANRQFRGKDQTTDVLSFPGDGAHLGDILISVPQA
ncbi:MAG TPA: rRNA maturation RNAse YbeY, partial [Thermoanaerobaculia bacterium]|nr:rRNA maturation RNAse YbeY [Thermoanaerobaculia bacterium]